MEPWDGPASVRFTDGNFVNACWIRNGLRPQPLLQPHDDHVIMASEVGVVPIDPANVKYKGSLRPVKCSPDRYWQGRMIPDEKLKDGIRQTSSLRWRLDDQRLELDKLHTEEEPHGFGRNIIAAQALAIASKRYNLCCYRNG